MSLNVHQTDKAASVLVRERLGRLRRASETRRRRHFSRARARRSRVVPRVVPKTLLYG
jgi:hypothetical protein